MINIKGNVMDLEALKLNKISLKRISNYCVLPWNLENQINELIEVVDEQKD